MTGTTAQGLTVLCAARLGGNQLERHLEPITMLSEVERVLLVRDEPIGDRLPKLEYVPFSAPNPAIGMLSMYRVIRRILRTEEVDWILGFNPLPWGLIALAAARRRHTRVCLSFIGLDFKRMTGMATLAPLMAAVRKADLVTVTGERMTEVLVERGVDPRRIAILPHAVDIQRFAPATDEPSVDVVSVGRLIQLKRMDVLVEAVALLRRNGRRVTVDVLGEGPLAGKLAAQIESRGLSGQIRLLGYRDDVERFLARAKLFALLSDWEGVPFAMIEAMCTGVVPIVTDVGTIRDWIDDGMNGRFVPVGDPAATADAIVRLLDDGKERARMRNRCLAIRDAISLESGANFWRSHLL